jgi:predicted outer membrane repeat protein
MGHALLRQLLRAHLASIHLAESFSGTAAPEPPPQHRNVTAVRTRCAVLSGCQPSSVRPSRHSTNTFSPGWNLRGAVHALGAALVLLAGVCPHAPGQSTPSFVVNTNQDDAGTTYSQCGATTGAGSCTLRDALAAARNAGSGNIAFDGTVFATSNSATANTIVLSNGMLLISPNTAITGPTPVVVNGVATPAVTVSGNNASTVFVFWPSQNTATAKVANLNIADGNDEGGIECPGCDGGAGGNVTGGGILNNGALTVSGCTFANNAAAYGYGGGIDSPSGTLTVSGSVFSNNTATLEGGGIWSAGTVTVTSATFSANSAENGGGIFNSGSLAVTRSTFLNNFATSEGGGIFNGGTATVTGSTFSNNSAGEGGGILNGDALTVAGATVSNNSATHGGGIYFSSTGTGGKSLVLANDVLDGNSGDDLDDSTGDTSFPAPIGSGGSCSGNVVCDAGGNVVGYYNGNVVKPAPVILATPGNYGGPTQTMIPLPGSRAICAGTAAPGGGLTLPTTDQRGDPSTNTIYSGYSSSSPCVDSGAVQTNYSMTFSTDPEPISPAVNVETATPFEAAVTLIESGVTFGSTLTPPATAPSVAIPLALTGNGALTGGLADTVNGVATYPLLRISQADTSDILTASLTLDSKVSPVPTLSSQSASFTVEQASPAPARLILPVQGSTLSGVIPTTFIWSTGSGVSSYWLFIGTTGPGSHDLYELGPMTGLSISAGPLPNNGGEVYVTLYSVINGVWQSESYTFVEPGTPAPATLTSPAVRSTLSSTGATTFNWTAGTGVTAYRLYLGTTGAGSSNLYQSPRLSGSQLSTTAGPFPASGGTIFATLNSLIDGVWQSEPYTFVESGTPAPAALISPTAGSTLSGTTATTFTWSTGTGVTAYWLYLGTTGPGSSDLFTSGRTTGLSVTTSNPLPSNGQTIYATLYSVIDGVWQPAAYTFTESGILTTNGTCGSTSGSGGTVSCTSSGAGNAGALIFAASGVTTTSGTGSVTFSSPQCSNWQPVAQPNSDGSGAQMNGGAAACILTATATPTVTASWSGTTGTTPWIVVGVFTISTGWNSVLLDRFVTSVNSAASTNCASGTSYTTRNPNTVNFMVCQTLSSETFTAPPGYTPQQSISTAQLSTLINTTKGTQSATGTLSASHMSTGMLISLNANPSAMNCSGCTFVQGADSSGETGQYDQITLSNVRNGDTLLYCQQHSGYTGSGTVTMTDALGTNIWVDPVTGTSGTSITVSDNVPSGIPGYGMRCFYSASINTGSLGDLTASVTGEPIFSDCSTSCAYVGGFFVELSGTFNIDAYSSNIGVSGAGSNNISCGFLTASQANDFILCEQYNENAASSNMSAGTTPIPFALPSIGGQANGQPEYGVWSSYGLTAQYATLSRSGLSYGGFGFAFK